MTKKTLLHNFMPALLVDYVTKDKGASKIAIEQNQLLLSVG